MELKKLIEKIAKEFEKYKIDYMIIGGQAVLEYLCELCFCRRPYYLQNYKRKRKRYGRPKDHFN
jgi:hypothetical protein